MNPSYPHGLIIMSSGISKIFLSSRIVFSIFLSLLLCGVLTPDTLQAANKGMLTGVHGDRQLLPKSCRACHRGMNMSIRGEERVCFTCHSNPAQRQNMEAQGYLLRSGRIELQSIETALRKPYSHPVLSVSNVHHRGEELPETEISAKRHAECVDCHEAHEATREAPFRGIRGKRVGSFVTEINKEYELCYRCHGRSANLPADSTDKQLEFRLTNKSYHPIEGEGANAHVISLKEPYAARRRRPGDISVITCSSCHGNDDPNGPKGPHGSNYRGLLVANYDMHETSSESTLAYELCYKCHERSSILGDESFPFHSLHILGNRGKNLPGTSCYTCHDAHGSSRNQYLIHFNLDVVEENSAGQLEYKAQGVASRKGSCALLCHGVDHAPKDY